MARSRRRVHGFDQIHRTWVDTEEVDPEAWWSTPLNGWYLEVLVLLQYRYKHYRTCCIAQNQTGEVVMTTDQGEHELNVATIGEAVEQALLFILETNPEPITLDVRFIVENGTTPQYPTVYGLRFGGW